MANALGTVFDEFESFNFRRDADGIRFKSAIFKANWFQQSPIAPKDDWCPADYKFKTEAANDEEWGHDAWTKYQFCHDSCFQCFEL